MRIRRLKLTGFKSFVEPAELRIEPGLTGVVGPNGCGKSNLLEAIRWAMGESSPKSLRGGGMEDVIFAGTATRAPRDFAEVSILVDRGATEEQPGGESEVTRRIERGAGSAYRLDGKDVRQKDVSLLFADAATGAHSPALVSQGKIGAVIAAKPVERRQLLEEAAGISGLHARRKDAEQKLRAAEANLTRLGEILGEQEQRASQLRRQARAAERYRKLSGEIREVEARLLHARWVEAEASADKARAEAQGANEEVERIARSIAEASAAQEAANRALTEKREALAAIREEGHALAHRLATARARRDTVGRRLAELDRLDRSLADDIAREEALKRDAGEALAQLENERAQVTHRLDQSEEHSARIASELTSLEASSREAEAALAEVLARQAAMRAERRVAEAAVEAARAQEERTQSECARIEALLAALGSGAAEERAREEAEARSTKASRDFARWEEQRARSDEARTAAAEQRDASESRLATARAAVSAARSEHEALARGLDQASGSVIASLRAEPGYERALAAALGEDSDAAIGADGPRRWQGSEAQDSDPGLPPGLQCLADHADAPAELQRRLRQVAVADDDEGQKLAVGQRLVTRDGKLRRWDGFVALSSGAAAAERLIRANRLSELAKALPGLQGALDEAQAERQSALDAMERNRAEADEARREALAAERDLREATRAIDVATAAIERLAAQRSGLAQRLEDLRPVVEAAAESMVAATRALNALPDPAALEQSVEIRAGGCGAGRERRGRQASRSRDSCPRDRERP